MFDRPTLERELIRDEGLRLHAYTDTVNCLTIGVGRNLDDVGISAAETRALNIDRQTCVSRGITREQALALLDADIDRTASALDRVLPWWRKLDPVRQRVLLNMAFNLGAAGLLGFKNTLRAIEAGQYGLAANGMLASKWRWQVGDRAQRLAAMMRTGVAP